MTLLIVDDEVLAIQGILDDVPWTMLHFEEILTANSYTQALNIFMKQNVDVLLCDIEMPYGSGLELVQWVKEHSKHTACVFLTCHDDFSFAKQAIALQCIGYILKPADTEEIVEYLIRAERKVMSESQNQMYYDYGKLYMEHLKEDVKNTGEGPGDMLKRAEEYIHSHITEPFSVEELAEGVFLSQAHLGRLFRKSYNMTVIDYITEQRMKLAKELLAGSEVSVSAVAAKCGYNNYSYFTRLFKKCAGETPREYRQRIGKGRDG